MWASKLCRNVCKYPSLIRTPIIFSKTNISKCLNRSFSLKTCKLQNVKVLKSEELLSLANKNTVEKSTVSTQKVIGYWLLGCSGMVYVAVALGGFTRLTESGLSMVTWKFALEKFPWSEQEWIAEFQRYQEYPEFKMLKRDITLSEFKRIWYTEYAHRNWGRLIGLGVLVPSAFFWFKGLLTPALKKRVVFFNFLVVAQGLMGWYMVKSGLEDRFHKQTDVPRVSQYRLAAHLGLALTLFTTLLWTAFDQIIPAQTLPVVTAGAKKIRMLAHSCKGMVFLTALSGAFVAGLDAGLVYSSFPKMGDHWIPDDILSHTPKIKNFTENPTTVQFDHRILGITTFSLIMATWLMSRKQSLPPRAQTAAKVLALVGCLQVILGISTLVHHVPVDQAVAHQSGSVVLLSAAIWLSHELKKMKYIPK